MTTHRLTGDDLEALLTRVPAEHGPDAVITEANKLRRGGIAGFFARESFEVVVDDDPGKGSTAGTSTDQRRAARTLPLRGRTLEDLVAAASAGDGPTPTTPVGTTSPGTTAMPAGTASTAMAGTATTSTAPAEAPAVTAGAPALSTEGQPFADVLGRLVQEVAGPATPAHTDPTQAALANTPAPQAAIHPQAAPALTSASQAAIHPQAAPALTSASQAAIHPQAAPAPLPVPALAPGGLAELGMPAPVVGALVAAGDPTVELLRLMEQVPRPDALPTAPGSVIAVIGGRDQARTVAGLLAGELRLDPDEIHLAATAFRGAKVDEDHRITSADDAGERRRSWRRRRGPIIVAVDAPVGRDPVRAAWALHLVDALEPSMVWGVVEAARKPEDVRCWTDLVGGIDALAVTDLDGTSSPASVLDVGVPVGLLDGQPATPARWTAVLAERLEIAA